MAVFGALLMPLPMTRYVYSMLASSMNLWLFPSALPVRASPPSTISAYAYTALAIDAGIYSLVVPNPMPKVLVKKSMFEVDAGVIYNCPGVIFKHRFLSHCHRRCRQAP